MLRPIISRRKPVVRHPLQPPIQPTGISQKPPVQPVPAPVLRTKIPPLDRPVMARRQPPIRIPVFKDHPEITLRRWAAVGDVIAASSVAKLLKERGFRVNLIAAPQCQEALRYCPHIQATSDTGASGIVLDGAYENHPDKKFRSIPELMIEHASSQMIHRGMNSLRAVNYANTLVVTEGEKEMILRRFNGLPRPWIVASPTSHRPARTVPPAAFTAIRKSIGGTLLWASNAEAPQGVHDLRTKNIRELMAAIAVSDLALVSESAPLHIAAGLKIPSICFRMSTDPIIRVSHQRDVLSYGRTDLSCLPCGEYVCVIDAASPPCAVLDANELVSVINRKIGQLGGRTVSAVIPVYSPDFGRLQRCLNSVIPQVDEVVVVLDGSAELPHGLPTHKVRVCRHKQSKRMGYGKTCNRGVLETSGEFLMFLNDDCYLNEGAVSRMLGHMHNRVAVVGCQQRYPDGRIYFGGAVRSDTGFAHIDHLQTRATISNACPAEFVNFAAALVRRKAFYEVEAFDERYDCYCEDADLCLRLSKARWTVVYEPAATAVHEESKTTGPMKLQLMASGAAVFNGIWLDHFRANARRATQVFA